MASLPPAHAEGCYLDGGAAPPGPRLLKKGVPGCDPGDAQLVTLPPGTTCVPAQMTPEYCAHMCWAGLQTTAAASGATILVGPEAGSQCFCDTVPEWNDETLNGIKLVPSKECNSPCDGGKSPLSDTLIPPGACGGGWKIDVYELDCGSAWGLTFMITLVAVSVIYVAGGVGFAAKTQGAEPKLQSHPHWSMSVSLSNTPAPRRAFSVTSVFARIFRSFFAHFFGSIVQVDLDERVDPRWSRVHSRTHRRQRQGRRGWWVHKGR